jgi:hypothetical protein
LAFTFKFTTTQLSSKAKGLSEYTGLVGIQADVDFSYPAGAFAYAQIVARPL